MKYFLPLAALLLVTACSTVKDQLGLDRRSPNEFAVVTRAPLEMPAETILPPPRPGAPRPQEVPTAVQAEQEIIGSARAYNAAISEGEMAILQNAKAGKADPAIRAKVEKDLAEGSTTKVPGLKKLLNIGSNKTPATVVDASEEAKRLQENKATGKPVTAGDTPTKDD
ncbi:MAG: DUF3035 domain-containing protein [Alphaproteobacteria bacterium]|nr:DUF3035 domain-containing protein [Alphaproteobacteria bacterium]